jgi:2-phospho-L-lactate guanylyltransferase
MALAFACDTVSVVLRVPIVSRVVVVTADPVVRRELSALGAAVVQDTTSDLNDALQLGAEGLSTGVAGLTADLPALRAGELARALGRIRRGPAFVPDADEVGTTLYAAPPGTPFRPMYGGRSRERHARHGAIELRLDDAPGLRRDVDTPENLRAAVTLGVGPRTAPIAADLLRYARPDRSASA